MTSQLDSRNMLNFNLKSISAKDIATLELDRINFGYDAEISSKLSKTPVRI